MSVAIRTITDLKFLDDVNVTVGAGVDEYALCWDNDTARFVLRAPFAGLLATGATTGATAQAQAFTNGIIGPSWKPSADSTTALQLQNASGASVLNVDTTNARVGIGASAPQVNFEVLQNADAVIGIGINNTNTGSSARLRFAMYQGATMIGLMQYAPASNFFQFGAFKANAEVRIGQFTSGTTDRIAIWTGGSGTATERAVILSNGYFGVGEVAPVSLIHGNLVDAATNTAVTALTVGHDTTGTAAAGFGVAQAFRLESSTTAAQSAARIQALWYEATHATRKADLVLTAYDTAEREGLRIRGNGSAAAIGFLGATPAARIAHVADPSGGGTVDAEARTAINSILTTLETFGFHATS